MTNNIASPEMNRFLRGFLILTGIGAAITFVLPVVLLIGFYVVTIGGEYLLRRDFDASAWRAAAQAEHDYPLHAKRLRMVDDLLDEHDFSGMRRAEVVALLGPADEFGWMTHWDLAYYLGPGRGVIQMDSEWLVFQLDEEQRVREHGIVVP